jgi:hypothetical protein
MTNTFNTDFITTSVLFQPARPIHDVAVTIPLLCVSI